MQPFRGALPHAALAFLARGRDGWALRVAVAHDARRLLARVGRGPPHGGARALAARRAGAVFTGLPPALAGPTRDAGRGVAGADTLVPRRPAADRGRRGTGR